MKKLAIFVEGQTEQIFVAKLLTEIAGKKNIVIENQTKIKELIFVTIGLTTNVEDPKYYVLIRDCKGDTSVKSAILDVCERFANKKYEKILGLRDVHPLSVSDIPKLLIGLKFGIPQNLLPIHILLAIMEIEAWFLAETSHFSKIDSSLSIDIIKENLGFDPVNEDVESRQNPAQDLHEIYQLVGKFYNKKKKYVQRTVNALDYGEIYLNLKKKIGSLDKFIEQIDLFLD